MTPRLPRLVVVAVVAADVARRRLLQLELMRRQGINLLPRLLAGLADAARAARHRRAHPAAPRLAAQRRRRAAVDAAAASQ
jgi:hypothetical protein